MNTQELAEITFVCLETASASDKHDLLVIAQKPEIMKFIGSGQNWSKDYMSSLKDDLLYYNWILKDKDTVIGYIGLRPMDYNAFSQASDGLQIRIFIHPGGKGYGSLALKELEKYTKGIRLWSIVEKNNEPSNKLFKNWTFVKKAFIYKKEHNFYLLDQLNIKEIKKGIYLIDDNYIDVGNKSLNHYMHFNYQQFKIYKSIPYYSSSNKRSYLFLGDSGLSKVPFYYTLKDWINLGSQQFPWKESDKVKVESSKLPSESYDDFLSVEKKDSIDWLRIEQVKCYTECFMKNKIDGHSFITDKSLLPLALPKYVAKSVDLFSKDVDSLSYPLIVKPVGNGAHSGKSIQIAKDKNALNDLILLAKNGRKDWKWIACEYIDEPLLFRTKKFHFRVYIIVGEKDFDLLPYYEILTAAKPYINSNYKDKSIHDSHGSSTPETFVVGLNVDYKPYMDKVKEVIEDELFEVLKGKLKPYSESKVGYEILALDIMFNHKKELIILEINDRVGLTFLNDKVGNEFNEIIAHWEIKFAMGLYTQ